VFKKETGVSPKKFRNNYFNEASKARQREAR
jgi:AraC-like DNA-binding protein